MAAAALVSDRLLMLASSCDRDAVGGDGRLVAIFGQRILEVEELSLQFGDRR